MSGCVNFFATSGGANENENILQGKHEFEDGSFTVKQCGTSWGGEKSDRDNQEVKFFKTEESVRNFLTNKSIDEDIRIFIGETDFETQRILFIGTFGTEYQFTQVMVKSLKVEEDSLIGTAGAYADSRPIEEAYKYPWILVRVAFNNDPVDRAKITVISGTTNQGFGGGITETFEVSAQ